MHRDVKELHRLIVERRAWKAHALRMRRYYADLQAENERLRIQLGLPPESQLILRDETTLCLQEGAYGGSRVLSYCPLPKGHDGPCGGTP